MSANFTPDMTGYKGLSPFRFWCQKTLPLVYDDSLSYYELLCKVVNYINNLITDVSAAEENVDKLLTAYNQLQEYVNNYFDGADFQQKIDDSLDRYAEDGTLSRMVNTHVAALLPYEVGQQIGPVVDEDLGPVVDLKLPAVVESKIAAPVATQLPAVVQTQIGGVVGNQIGDVVADQIDEVVADQITDAVSPLVHDEVTGLIRPAVATELPAALQVYLPPEVQTQLPGAIGTDLENIAPPVIEDWLDAHPEATTSVPDGSISFSKLATDLQRRAGIVGTYFPSDFTNEYAWQVNQYAVYQGIVYRCIKTTTAGQAWNASEWTTANMNSDLFYMWWCLNYLSQSITTIDSSPATSAHEAGEYFIYYDGAHLYRLAKASSNIAVGDTLTVNGNFIYSSVANMIADLKVEIADLKSALNTLDGVIYPNVDVLLKTNSGSLATQNQYWELGTLVKNHAYRIWLKFSEDPVRLSNLRTSKSESGVGNVDTVTDSFDGSSWTEGKTLIYTPTVDDIKYLQIQFNSSYTANEYSAELKVYDYTKETTSAITELKDADSVIDTRINALEPTIILSDDYNLLPPGGYTLNKLILPNGTINNYNGYVLSDYIELDPSQEYICNYAKTASVVYGNSGLTGNINTFDRINFCFFDENKNVVPYTGDTTAISKAIPDGAKYIRVCVVSESAYPLARLIYGNYNTQPIVRIVDYKQRLNFPYLMPNTGYENFKMVMFGDSITHGSLSAGDAGISYVDYANDALNSNIINVGFGGTRMTYALEDAGLFCFYNLCDCITSESADAWAELDTYAEDNTTYAEHLATLKAVDWSTVNAIGLMYGANDYASSTPVGTAYNETLTNYDGACAYGLKKLLTKYPHLQVLILAPFDREMTAGNAATMTDRAQNSAGLIMADYANSLENVVSRFHCPLVKTGNEWGINEYTILTYAPDGTHPRANIAQKRLGWLFANAIRRYLAPFN